MLLGDRQLACGFERAGSRYDRPNIRTPRRELQTFQNQAFGHFEAFSHRPGDFQLFDTIFDSCDMLHDIIHGSRFRRGVVKIVLFRRLSHQILPKIWRSGQQPGVYLSPLFPDVIVRIETIVELQNANP